MKVTSPPMVRQMQRGIAFSCLMTAIISSLIVVVGFGIEVEAEARSHRFVLALITIITTDPITY